MTSPSQDPNQDGSPPSNDPETPSQQPNPGADPYAQSAGSPYDPNAGAASSGNHPDPSSEPNGYPQYGSQPGAQQYGSQPGAQQYGSQPGAQQYDGQPGAQQYGSQPGPDQYGGQHYGEQTYGGVQYDSPQYGAVGYAQSQRRSEPGFFRALFDFRFETFIAVRWAGIVYLLAIIVAALSWLATIITGIAAGSAAGLSAAYWGEEPTFNSVPLLLALFFGWIVPALWVIFVRLILELIVASVKTAEHTKRLADSVGR